MSDRDSIRTNGGACFFPHSTAARAPGVWMFFLVQSLYFVLTGNTGDLEEGKLKTVLTEKADGLLSEIIPVLE